MINIIWDKGFKKSYKKKIGNSVLLKKKFLECDKFICKKPL